MQRAITIHVLVTGLLATSGQLAAQSAPPPIVPSASSRVTSDPGQELNPSLSPDGDAVVYDKLTSPGNRDLYLVRAGSAPVNLTPDSPAPDIQPAFSPDGRQIAFRSGREGGGIFVMNADGGSARRLSDAGFNPSWSPNGREILYGTLSAAASPYGAATGGGGVWAVDVQTGERRQLSTAYVFQPTASPSGERIAVWGLGDGTPAGGVRRDIWTMRADGSDLRAVTQDEAVDWSPIWSPDGRHLYFASDRDGSMKIWRVQIDQRTGVTTGSPELVTTDAGAQIRGHLTISRSGDLAYIDATLGTSLFKTSLDPASRAAAGGAPRLHPPALSPTADFDVSPNGEWIAFRTGQGREDLYVVGSDGTGLRRLTDDLYRDRAPAWSPDGSRIAFRSDRPVDGQRGYRWYEIRPDGTGLRQLLDVGPTGFRWSPDGARIVTSGPTAIGVVDADGSDARALAATQGAFSAPVWSPDGRRIAYREVRDGKGTTFTLDATRPGAAPEALPTRDFTPVAWSSDGRLLLGNEPVGATGIRPLLYDFAAAKYEEVAATGTAAGWLSDGRSLLVVQAGATRIQLVDRVTGQARDVVTVEAPNTVAVQIGRHDRELFYLRTDAQADVYRMRLPR